MKKIFSGLLFIFIFSSVSYGAVSQDIYVRQDVFDAKMEALFERFHGEIKALSEKIDGVEKTLSEKIDGVDKTLSEKIDGNFATLSRRIDGVEKTLSEKVDGVNKTLSEKIDGVDKTLSRRIDGLEKRIEDTNNFLYYLLVLFGAMLILPFVNKWWENRKESSFTLDDVKKLIADAIAEAQLSVKN